MYKTVKAATLALALAALVAPSSDAQSTRARWQGWLGCWTAAPAGASYGSAQFAAPVVCVVPTSSNDAVDVVTLAEGKVASTDRIDASGAASPLAATGCSGTKSGQWSRDERRIFLKSNMTCEGMTSATTSILSMTPEGEWLDVRGVTSGGAGNVRTARYREVGIPSALPAEMAGSLRNVAMAAQHARFGAGAIFGTAAVIEAAQVADSAVVEAWLLEQGQAFSLNARELVALADAGVPAKVTDAMIAVSNPGAFTVARNTRDADEEQVAMSRGRRIPVYMDPYSYPWSYGYSRYDMGYGYGYGTGRGYYGNNYGGYYGGPPIIVVQGESSGGRGQMVKGRGYSSNDPSPSSTRSGGDRSSNPSPSSSSSGSSTSASPSRPATESAPAQRTAKPRDP